MHILVETDAAFAENEMKNSLGLIHSSLFMGLMCSFLFGISLGVGSCLDRSDNDWGISEL